jgi:hypothetical protein
MGSLEETMTFAKNGMWRPAVFAAVALVAAVTLGGCAAGAGYGQFNVNGRGYSGSGQFRYRDGGYNNWRGGQNGGGYNGGGYNHDRTPYRR